MVAGGLTVHLARSARARLLGLALLRDLPPDRALLIAGCRSVHTFGMRFALDVVFLDAAGRPLRVVRGPAAVPRGVVPRSRRPSWSAEPRGME